MWTDFFDRIFLISLDYRKSDNLRLPGAKAELEKFGIPYEVHNAKYYENGVFACFMTYQHLFEDCLQKGYKNIFVFEDDVHFKIDPTSIMNQIIEKLPRDYDTIHMGPNTHTQLQYFYKPFLLTMSHCRSTHAQGYSAQAMNTISSYPWIGKSIDQMIEENLQYKGRCFCTNPLLATQTSGISDIDKRYVNNYYIEDRFAQNTKHLL